jgi:hypothetical protein
MSVVTILGKVNAKMEFISVKKIKGSFIRTLKKMGDVDKERVIVIDWPLWHLLSSKVQKRYNFVIFSERSDWAEEVWATDHGKSLFTDPMFGSSDIVVAGSGDHIKRVVSSIGPECVIPKIVVVPTIANCRGAYSLLGSDTAYYRDDNDDKVQTFLY